MSDRTIKEIIRDAFDLLQKHPHQSKSLETITISVLEGKLTQLRAENEALRASLEAREQLVCEKVKELAAAKFSNASTTSFVSVCAESPRPPQTDKEGNMKLELRISIIVVRLLARILQKLTYKFGSTGEDETLLDESQKLCQEIRNTNGEQ